ncbi:hypothetical protein [Streptomyces iconiensis]|uniref:PRD domain-containing protein n=1 Tax=Streptomyces iconiensis TaxID=1384038 RepID=A0ABT6ZXF7_9ACTN|nr:hypothetical protein [Streptomyces iconiensis]MDJ1133759.1 hypothetical protein [Streptomyces iconiensis]
MIHLTERLAETVADSSAPVDAADRADLGELLPLVQYEADQQGLALDDERLLAVAVHCLAFARRVRGGEYLDPLGDELYTEVPADRLAAARHLIDTYCGPRGYTAPDSEVLLLALHFEVARRSGDTCENPT